MAATKVLARAPVEEILTTTSRWGRHKAVGVRVNGININVRSAVVSDAGFSKTFEVDVDGHQPLVKDRIVSSDQLALVHRKDRLPLLQPSHAFVYLFVGLEGTDLELELPGQNIWHLRDWDHDSRLGHLYDAEKVQDTTDEEPPLVFLSNESAKDPDYWRRHPGKSTVTLIAWTKMDWFKPWHDTDQGHRGDDYVAMKQKLTRNLLDILHLHFPKTRERVAYAELGTPLSANKYLGRGNGEIYNLDHNVGRFDSLGAQLALHPQTTIQGLYLAGQDAVAVSIEGATMSGVFVSSRVSIWALAFVCLPAAIGWLTWI